MKILLISEYNFLTTTGGTEYYTSMLAEGLVKQGIELEFISRGYQDRDIVEKSIACEVGTYQLHLLPNTRFTVAEVRQNVVSHTWPSIKRVLDNFQPDIIHVHTLSTFFNIRHIEKCRQLFKKIIFTSHVPGHFCLKADMIRNNKIPCDGKIGFQCNVCLLSTNVVQGGVALMKKYVGRKMQQLSILQESAVHIVCTSNWQRSQLLLNQYPSNYLSVIRQALQTMQLNRTNSLTPKGGKLRVGYLGRLSPEKGSKLLLSIIEGLQDQKDFEFILAIPSNSNDEEIQKLQNILLLNDIPVRLLRDINRDNKADFFNSVDVLLITSFCLETGPIVLLEAIYYGKYVIAPNVGGPLEFANAYPVFVRTYKWNDQDDILKKMYEIKNLPLLNDIELKNRFKQKEEQFIHDHIELYQKNLI